MKPSIVMRSHNDMPLIAATLAALREQSLPFELLVFDNASTDGTLEEVEKFASQIIHVPKGKYVPGQVLNRGMELSQGEIVVFLNSDCTPQNRHWLERLVQAMESENVAAAFSRQLPRPDCQPLFAKDTTDTYGDGQRQARWRHCFSMASSALRRSVWNELRFNEGLGYSEDIDWSWRARELGYRIVYQPDSIVSHSHNYSLRQFYRRHFGEGQAEAQIFHWSRWQRSLLRYSLLPYLRQVVDDWRYCVGRREFAAAVYAPVLRAYQLCGRRAGLKAGFRSAQA